MPLRPLIHEFNNFNQFNKSPSRVLNNWLPYHLFADSEGWKTRWLYLGDRHFAEPFFDETLAKCLVLPANSHPQRSVSSLDVVADTADQLDCLQPTAFIFHVSRCGSTLLSQWLSLLQRHVVVPEYPFLDQVWRLKFAPTERPVTNAQRLRYLRAAIRWAGQRRLPGQEHFFVKLDSWHTLLFDELQQLYPHTPCVFLYREPEAVLRSHARQPGVHAVPGLLEPQVFGWDSPLLSDGLPAYTAAVIQRIYEGMLAASARCERALLLNYNTGMLDNFAQMQQFLGLEYSAAEQAQVLERSQFHSKRPEQTFSEPDTPQPRLSTDDLLRAYVRLEGCRHLGPAPHHHPPTALIHE